MTTVQPSDAVRFRATILLAGKTAMPPDLGAALDIDGEARRCFDGLAYSHRLRWVLSVEGAKTEETRRRRIAKAVEALREGRR